MRIAVSEIHILVGFYSHYEFTTVCYSCFIPLKKKKKKNNHRASSLYSCTQTFIAEGFKQSKLKREKLLSVTQHKIHNSAQCCVSYRNQSFLFCFAKLMTGFYMKRNIGQEWVKSLMLPRIQCFLKIMIKIFVFHAKKISTFSRDFCCHFN